MKKALVFLIIISYGIDSKAQTNTSNDTETPQKLWLYNNGKIIADQDDEVDKNYFNADKIFLQSNPPLREGQKYALIITPVKGESKVYIFENTELSDDLIRGILEQKKGTRVVFAIMKEQNRVILSFTLK